jgi:hypothetical protein
MEQEHAYTFLASTQGHDLLHCERYFLSGNPWFYFLGTYFRIPGGQQLS